MGILKNIFSALSIIKEFIFMVLRFLFGRLSWDPPIWLKAPFGWIRVAYLIIGDKGECPSGIQNIKNTVPGKG